MSSNTNKSEPNLTVTLSLNGQAAITLLALFLNLGFSPLVQTMLKELFVPPQSSSVEEKLSPGKSLQGTLPSASSTKDAGCVQ